MRLFKAKSPFVFLAAVLALGVLPLAAFAQPPRDTAAANLMREKAWNEGQVRVIVHFAVPDIEGLTAASTQFWDIDKTPEMARDRNIADTNLSKSIEYASWGILTELQGTDFEVLARFDYIPAITLRVSPEGLAVLENSPNVLGVHEDIARRLIEPVEEITESTKGSSPAADDTIDPMLQDTATLVGAKNVWAMGYTGAGWYVAVLDTGIRKSHEFFTGKTILEACRAMGRDGTRRRGRLPQRHALAERPRLGRSLRQLLQRI